MFKDLTKGGQTFFQSMRMFFDIFWKLVIAFILVWIVSFALIGYVKTTSYQRYKIYVLLKAEPMSFLFHRVGKELGDIGLVSKNNPESGAKITFQNEDGSAEHLTDDEAVNRVATSYFIGFIRNLLFWNSIQSTILSFLMTYLLAWFLIRFGQAVTEQKTLRGTTLQSSKELSDEIRNRNRKKLSPLSIAKVPLPEGGETKHIWINGTTGAGKTVAFSELMTQVRKQKGKAIVYDIMGTFTARFYRPGKDIILNPFDDRSPAWNLWAECEKSVDYEALAASLIPIIPGAASQDPFWTKAARSLVSATARRLAKTGKPKTITLLRYLLTADLEKLQDLLKNTEAEALVSEKLEKTALSVKAVLNDYIKSMRFLHDDGDLFSIRDWVKNEDDDSWLFITSRSDYHETLKPLISAWYDVAITTALSLPHNQKRRIYNFIDELPTLQYLPSLEKGISQGRQFGLCFVLGTQALSQMRVSYGVDNAKTVVDNCNTKIMLRTAGDADQIAGLFNKSELQENSESVSYGVTDNRDGVSISKRTHMQYVVLPSELQDLDDLNAYLRVPGSYPVAKITFDYVKYPEPNERLVPRDADVDWLVEGEESGDDDFHDDVPDALEEKDLYKPAKKELAKPLLKEKGKASEKKRTNILEQEVENANVPLGKSMDDEDIYKV